MRSLVIAFALLFMVGSEAIAGVVSGNKLKQYCFSGEPDGRPLCLGCILGAVDQLAAIDQLSPGSQNLCLPEGTTGGQFQAIVERYLMDHPEQLRFPGAGLVHLALMEAFPCKGN